MARIIRKTKRAAAITAIILASFFINTSLYFLYPTKVIANPAENDVPKLIATSEQTVRIPNSIDHLSKTDIAPRKVEDPCEGNWLEFKNEKINLQTISLAEWGKNTSPSILKESLNTNNFFILGHNICINQNCYQAGSQFSQIIALAPGDNVKACISNNTYKGSVIITKPVNDTEVEVMGDWLSGPSITLMTSYGLCKDAVCSSTYLRWIVGLERD